MDNEKQTLALFRRLFEPFKDELKKTKKQGGRSITFVEWVQYIIRAHQEFSQGFHTEVRSITEIARGATDDDGNPLASIILVVRVTCIATGMYHEATGMAPATKDKATWGGAAAEAESQALRRAFAHFGLGLEMYLDDDEFFYTRDSVAVALGVDTDEDPEGEEDEENGEGGDPTAITEAQQARIRQYRDRLLEGVRDGVLDASEVEGMLSGIRSKLKKSKDRKKAAGVVIRRLRSWAEEAGFDLDTEGEG